MYMETVRISSDVYYIGVNDRTTHRFEAMWPLPSGVSYNSYLVCGRDKAAIIDGVEKACAQEQIEHIRAILGDRRPDYLIINHMEPDHSGAISLLRQAFPGIRIVGNLQTLNMIKGFYGIADDTLKVGNGDTLELGGGVDLTFYLTPMVHWPETMMTYLATEQTLFAGDAFGCFGALNGAVLDTDMNTDRYFPEMVRYYSNIVGKYGVFVQKALARLEPLTVTTICSTHGPVWRRQAAKVIDLYDRLSRYQPLDNGVTIVYGSMYGNTERMAEAAAQTLAAEGVRDISVLNASVTHLSYILAEAFTHRGLIIAAPTYSDTLFPPIAAVMEGLVTRSLRNREIAVFGGCTWSQRAAKILQEYLQALDTEGVVPPVAFKQAPDAGALDASRDAARTLAHKLID